MLQCSSMVLDWLTHIVLSCPPPVLTVLMSFLAGLFLCFGWVPSLAATAPATPGRLSTGAASTRVARCQVLNLPLCCPSLPARRMLCTSPCWLDCCLTDSGCLQAGLFGDTRLPAAATPTTSLLVIPSSQWLWWCPSDQTYFPSFSARIVLNFQACLDMAAWFCILHSASCLTAMHKECPWATAVGARAGGVPNRGVCLGGIAGRRQIPALGRWSFGGGLLGEL
jgi:hypothetical protein